MTAPPQPPPTEPVSIRKTLLRPRRFRWLDRGGDGWLKWHFAGHAAISVVVLLLIVFTLFREASGFIPRNRHNLEIYRRAGLEYVDILKRQVDDFTALVRQLSALRVQWSQQMAGQGIAPDEIEARLSEIDVLDERLADAIGPHRDLLSEMTEHASAVKERDKIARDYATGRELLLAEAAMAESERAARLRAEAEKMQVEKIDFRAEVQPLLARMPEVRAANRLLTTELATILGALPRIDDPVVAKQLDRFAAAVRDHLASLSARERQMEQWQPDRPVSMWDSLHAFAFGRDWITASFWQDWYGVLPLLFGSFFVSMLSLAIAIPLGLCAALYVNQVARSWEQRFIKPSIEFIAAIPSVVLGFFGIAVLGETLRLVSRWEALAWVPGFPMQERLTAFTAAVLLALMAIPTIFTLAEDALQNVPRALREASFALGATRLQTIVHVVLPASLSGIAAAVLLGFGRVIGETMVVLLCAGNRIAIPDFSAGPGVIFQPVHTMTGIIAQEMGEVVHGSLHYRALFMVGSLLFLLSLLINYGAQKIVRRYRLPSA